MVLVGRLVGDKFDLVCFFEGFGGIIMMCFIGGVIGFIFNDCDFIIFSV